MRLARIEDSKFVYKFMTLFSKSGKCRMVKTSYLYLTFVASSLLKLNNTETVQETPHVKLLKLL